MVTTRVAMGLTGERITCYTYGINKGEHEMYTDMNAHQAIKELRKPGKVAITISGTELEVFADKSDLIAQVEHLGDADHISWTMVDRGTHRTLLFSGEW